MKALKIIIALILGISLVVFVTLFFVGYFKPSKAGILIDANRSSLVFINNEQVGRTKYEGTYPAGEVKVKIVPESFDKPLPPYEVKVDLLAGVKTMIQRDFGDNEETSGGAIISFQKNMNDEAGIAIVSVPDSAQVKIDGQVRDTTPTKIDAVSDGEHLITLSLSGYLEKTLKVRTYKGYKLTAVFTLAPDRGYVDIMSPTPTPSPGGTSTGVKILDTPTGFLRVRSEPSSIAKEIGQVEPGKIYYFIEQDETTGWMKIEFEEEENDTPVKRQGWISSQYVKRVEETPTPRPSPSPSASPR